jgi:hypothetical protein
VIRDLAVMLADGGDCLSDLRAVRDQEPSFGAVASDTTAFRLIDAIAGHDGLLQALRGARARARSRAWELGARPERIVIDVDATPTGKINVTDPDSRTVKSPKGYIQGYNAQPVVNDERIVIAAELSAASPDFGRAGTNRDRRAQRTPGGRRDRRSGVVLADAGYWHHEQMDQLRLEHGLQILIPPDAGNRTTSRPGWNGGRYAFMRRALQAERGKTLYKQRKALIEPVFGHTKFNRRIERFQRRGLAACRSEWRLIAATHNLTQALPPPTRRRGCLTTPVGATAPPTRRLTASTPASHTRRPPSYAPVSLAACGRLAG